MTNILGYHLVVLGVGALFFVADWMFIGGAYDTWAPGGGEVRLVSPTLDPRVILGYLFRSPWGGAGSIIGVNSIEDIVGGHVYVGITAIIGGYSIYSQNLLDGLEEHSFGMEKDF